MISAYIALRFEWKFAVPVLIALMHDLLITAGVYALTGREVTTSTVAALLTILGYSLYDTIIVFDRIRENVPRMPRAAFSQIVNRSMSEVLTRSLATSFCTLLPILALLLFGGETLQGLRLRAARSASLSGAYSSIFIASPVLTHWKEREPVYRRAPAAGSSSEHGGVVPGLRDATRRRAIDGRRPRRAERAARRLTAPDEPERGVSRSEFERDGARARRARTSRAPSRSRAEDARRAPSRAEPADDADADARPRTSCSRTSRSATSRKRPRNRRHGRPR